MPRVEDALKNLIQYHAKKAAAQVFGETAAQLREMRREVRDLRSTVHTIEGVLKALVTARERQMAVPPAAREEVESARFSPAVLKGLRKKLSLTQTELARLLDVSAVTVAAWETGRSRPRRANLAQLVTLQGMGAGEVDSALGRQPAPDAPKPEQLRKLRSHFCITQAELARLLSVSPASVTSWEAGKAMPGRNNRRAIAGLQAVPAQEIDQRLGRSPGVPVAVRRRGLKAGEIKSLREKTGLSQKALAQRIGVSVNSVSNWETGRTAPRARSVHQMLALAAR